MAMTYLERIKQQQQTQNPAQRQESGLQGVSTATQEQLNRYQAGYQPSQQANTAQQNMEALQAQKPQSFMSKYGGTLDSILERINTPQDFKYEFSGDGMFKNLEDVYTQKGKQASADAMGQAAGLTGGYGNTYAQGAGQQAYQQYLMDLYGAGMDLSRQAFERYQAGRADDYNRLAAVQNMDESDYNRSRDQMADWRQDVADARDAYRDERDFGYNVYTNDRDYWQNLAAMENADFRAGQDQDLRIAQLDETARATDMENEYRRDMLDWQKETDARDYAAQQYRLDQDEQFRRDSLQQSQQQFEASTKLDYDRLAEQIRQYDTSMSEDQRQYNQKMAASWVADILANGQIPSMDLLIQAGLSYEDAKKLVAQATGSGGRTTNDKDSIKNAVAAIANVGTIGAVPTPLTGMPLGAVNYEQEAKDAAAMAKNYEKGSADQVGWDNYAKEMSEISRAMDQSTSEWQEWVRKQKAAGKPV